MDSATLPTDLPRARRHRASAIEVKKINVALQGGGAHGAFAWGVLDRLLEDERVEIEGISATSAGAMNATVHIAADVNKLCVFDIASGARVSA